MQAKHPTRYALLVHHVVGANVEALLFESVELRDREALQRVGALDEAPLHAALVLVVLELQSHDASVRAMVVFEVALLERCARVVAALRLLHGSRQ